MTNPVRSLMAWAVSGLGVVTLLIDLIFHHHIGGQIFAGIAYLALAVIIFFDMATTPRAKSPFCQALTPDEVKTFKRNHVWLIYPGAAHAYAASLVAFSMVGVLWAIGAYLDHGYLTGSLLVLFFILAGIENMRLAPVEHTTKSAVAGNIIALRRLQHMERIQDRLQASQSTQDKRPEPAI